MICGELKNDPYVNITNIMHGFFVCRNRNKIRMGHKT